MSTEDITRSEIIPAVRLSHVSESHVSESHVSESHVSESHVSESRVSESHDSLAVECPYTHYINMYTSTNIFIRVMSMLL